MSLIGAKFAYQNQRGLYIDLARGHLADAKRCRKYGDLHGSLCHFDLAQRNRKRVKAINEALAIINEQLAV